MRLKGRHWLVLWLVLLLGVLGSITARQAAGFRTARRLRDLREERMALEARRGELERRIRKLPGFGDMKVIALGATLSKRFDVAVADGLVPEFPTLGDVDSVEALESYQAAKRAHKAAVRAARQAEPA